MVLTRSGKSTAGGLVFQQPPGDVVIARSRGTKRPFSRNNNNNNNNALVEIFCDSNEPYQSTIVEISKPIVKSNSNDENAQQFMSGLDAVKKDDAVSKKPRVLGDATALTLNALSNTIPVDLSAKDVKKVNISLEEKAMNGAPEGDLYDVVLLEDSQLLPFADEETANSELSKAMSQFSSTSIWAEKYEVITTLRRIVRHHPKSITEGNYMDAMINNALEQVSSLRSSTIRNALSCLKLAATVYGQGLWSEASANLIFTALLNKSGNGPKFLCDTAFETCRAASESCPISFFVSAIHSMINHKNVEVAAKSVEILVQSVLKSDKAVLCSADSVTCNILTSLCLGLNSKKAQAKDRSKEALQYVKAIMGSNEFDSFVDEKLPSAIGGELKRELSKSTGAPTTAPKPFASKFPSSFNKAGTSSTFVKPTVVTGVPTAPCKPWEKAAPKPSAPCKPWERVAPKPPAHAAATNAIIDSNVEILDVPSIDILDGLEDIIM